MLVDELYFCGPEAFSETLKQQLAAYQFDTEHHYHEELFVMRWRYYEISERSECPLLSVFWFGLTSLEQILRYPFAQAVSVNIRQ